MVELKAAPPTEWIGGIGRTLWSAGLSARTFGTLLHESSSPPASVARGRDATPEQTELGSGRPLVGHCRAIGESNRRPIRLQRSVLAPLSVGDVALRHYGTVTVFLARGYVHTTNS